MAPPKATWIKVKNIRFPWGAGAELSTFGVKQGGIGGESG
jgi:hypothetical protein